MMHLLLPLPVGDKDFYAGDEFTVYEANGGMPLPFCISLLESVLPWPSDCPSDISVFTAFAGVSSSSVNVEVMLSH